MEKKLSIVIIPLVTTFIGVGVPLALTTGGGGDQGSLAPAGLAVTNEPDKTPRIDLLLRNTSEDVAVIDRVEFRVLDFERSEGDNCPKGGADIPVSETYELVLPAEDGAGRTATIDTAQQLRPGEADRFSFRASLDDPSAVWLSENPLLGEARFFQLEAHVYHDGEPKPLLAGQAILRAVFSFPLTGSPNVRLDPALDGGGLMDVGSYCVSGARLLGGEPIQVYGEQVTAPTGVDEVFTGTMRFEEDALAEFDCGLVLPVRDELEVIGEEGSIFLDDPWHCREPVLELHTDRRTEEITLEAEDSYRLELENLSEAICGRAEPLLGRDDALGQARAIEALYRAAAEGVPVAMPYQAANHETAL